MLSRRAKKLCCRVPTNMLNYLYNFKNKKKPKKTKKKPRAVIHWRASWFKLKWDPPGFCTRLDLRNVNFTGEIGCTPLWHQLFYVPSQTKAPLYTCVTRGKNGTSPSPSLACFKILFFIIFIKNDSILNNLFEWKYLK